MKGILTCLLTIAVVAAEGVENPDYDKCVIKNGKHCNAPFMQMYPYGTASHQMICSKFAKMLECIKAVCDLIPKMYVLELRNTFNISGSCYSDPNGPGGAGDPDGNTSGLSDPARSSGADGPPDPLGPPSPDCSGGTNIDFAFLAVFISLFTKIYLI